MNRKYFLAVRQHIELFFMALYIAKFSNELKSFYYKIEDIVFLWIYKIIWFDSIISLQMINLDIEDYWNYH